MSTQDGFDFLRDWDLGGSVVVGELFMQDKKGSQTRSRV